jgi:adenosylcobinamide kinase / adenosylcobinamide-phosphate guanylyltransferase
MWDLFTAAFGEFMMIFVTGPLFAGKEDYIKEKLGWDQETFQQKAVRDVQDLAAEAEDLTELADQLAEKEVVLATEVGAGVVPIDPKERYAREQAGRLACILARRADVVIRLCCGLPQFLKGEL